MKEEIDAGAELIREFDKYVPVKAAFWLKKSDEEYRYLYIASERIDSDNKKAAYGEVGRLASKIHSPYFSVFRVKLINAENTLAKAAVEINQRFPDVRFGGISFAGTIVNDVYIYPSPLPAAVT